MNCLCLPVQKYFFFLFKNIFNALNMLQLCSCTLYAWRIGLSKILLRFSLLCLVRQYSVTYWVPSHCSVVNQRLCVRQSSVVSQRQQHPQVRVSYLITTALLVSLLPPFLGYGGIPPYIILIRLFLHFLFLRLPGPPYWSRLPECELSQGEGWAPSALFKLNYGRALTLAQ